MTIATRFASLICIAFAAAAQDRPAVFACNPKAIGASARPRYAQLIRRVREAARGKTELSNGYAFRLDSAAVTLPEVAEWIAMERLCCPFLTLQLSATGNQAHWVLTLTGPEGVKPILDAAFPSQP